MFGLKHCHKCYMKKYGTKRVGERQMQHKAKLSAIFHLEITP